MILLKLIFGGFGWLKDMAVKLIDLALDYPRETAIAVLLCFSAWSWNGWSDEKAGRKQDAKEYKDELAKRDQASAEALAQQIALNEQTKAKYEAAAKEADHDYRIALADADRRTDRYIRDNRVRKAGGSGASGSDATAEGEAAGGSDPASPGAELVTVTADDVRICTANTVRLQAVREWGLELVKAGVAE